MPKYSDVVVFFEADARIVTSRTWWLSHLRGVTFENTELREGVVVRKMTLRRSEVSFFIGGTLMLDVLDGKKLRESVTLTSSYPSSRRNQALLIMRGEKVIEKNWYCCLTCMRNTGQQIKERKMSCSECAATWVYGS